MPEQRCPVTIHVSISRVSNILAQNLRVPLTLENALHPFHPSSPQRRPEAKVPPNMPNKILVVHDSSNERNGLCRLLERAGYEVRSAADGVEALEKVRSDRFDLLLVDIWMPRMNGVELLALLPEDSRPKALIITGEESPEILHPRRSPSAERLHRSGRSLLL